MKWINIWKPPTSFQPLISWAQNKYVRIFQNPGSRQHRKRLTSIRSDQIRSVAQSCPTLCDPMNRSMPGLPVQHQLPEFTSRWQIEGSQDALGFPCSSFGKESICNAGDMGSVPGLGRSPGSPGEGNGNQHQYSLLENPMNRGAWQATVHGVTRVGQNLEIKPPQGALPNLPLLVSPSTATYPGVLLISSVQSLSCVWLFVTPWTALCQASLSITNSWSLLKLMSIELVMPSNDLILFHPLLLLSSIFPSIRVFSNDSVLHIRWPKYWSFSFSISPSNEYSGLISFRMYWLDLLAIQGTLKSLLQHHRSKASITNSSNFSWGFSTEGLFCLIAS